MTRTTLSFAALATLVLAAGCDAAGTTLAPGEDDGGGPVLAALQVAPEGRTVQAGAQLRFTVAGTLSDGSGATPAVRWSATGGTIDGAGLYTAGQAAGAFRVIAAAENGPADTVAVNVAVPTQNPTLVAVVLTPASATVVAGGTVQFAASGLLSNGATTPVSVTWSATGGAVSQGGLYTAGTGAGTFRVVAAGPGGLADTASVAVTASSPPSGSYTPVAGDDWSYAGKAELKAQNLFWWYRSEDVYQDVDLVQDRTFGQVARIRFRQSGETGFAPKMQQQLPRPLDHAWYRWRIRYEPGWTTVGPSPAGYANSWKMSFWTWENYGGRGAIQLSNTDQNIMEWNVQNRSTGTFYQYAEHVLPNSVGQPLGSVSQAWQDGEWYEYIIHYHRVSDTQARQEYWYRRLTSGGQIVDRPFIYHGADFTGTPMPRMAGIELGVNKNKSNPTTMYVYWGPWEVVDGSKHANPFGLPGR